MKKITLVFDIDDTICNNNNRDYENAIPIKEVVDKINNLHEQGAKIVLYTSRGMVSCKGDIEKIIAKNEAVLKRWLEKNNVAYDELIFGKPLGDMYVDDKAINVKDFIESDFKVLNGKSGYPVIKLGNLVKKEMSEENYHKLMNWYTDSKGIANSPKITSNLYSTVYMEYIDGENAYECLNSKILGEIIQQIEYFKKIKYSYFDKQRLIDKLEKHKSKDEEWNKMVDDCEYLVDSIDLEKFASLSHGDLSLNNIIVKDEELYLLDSLYDREASSYLIDYAKLKMSMDGYDELFLDAKPVDKKLLNLLEAHLDQEGILGEVNILELMHAVRLYNYNDDKEKVKKFVRRLSR